MSTNEINNSTNALGRLSGATFLTSVVTNDNNKPDEKLFEGAFPNNPELQGVIDSEYSALLKLNHTKLREERMQFLKTLVDNVKTKEKTGNITEKDLKELKDKIDHISNNGLEGEVKDSVENPIIANDFGLEEGYENKPFYLGDNGIIKIAVNNWPDIDMIKIIEGETDGQKLLELMNKRYVDVKKLMDISTPDVKNLVGMLYEIVVDPKKLVLYREELQGQSWYREELKKHDLDENIGQNIDNN